MKNSFDDFLINLEKELQDLKTSSSKSASVLELWSDSYSQKVNLILSDDQLYASNKIEVKIMPSATEMVFMPSIIDYNDGRERILLPYFEDDYYLIHIAVEGTANDIQSLRNGNTVTVDLGFRLTATSKFTMESVS